MSLIDRQRVAAVRLLEAMGYRFSGGTWIGLEAGTIDVTAEADALHALLVERADRLIGGQEGSAEEDDLEAVGEALEAYEAKRWPGWQGAGRQGIEPA